MIDIKNHDKADVLAALFNHSRQQGMGFLAGPQPDMTNEQAAELLKGGHYFDYVGGKVMKVDLSGDEIDPRLYDRDNGDGAAQRAIESIQA